MAPPTATTTRRRLYLKKKNKKTKTNAIPPVTPAVSHLLTKLNTALQVKNTSSALRLFRNELYASSLEMKLINFYEFKKILVQMDCGLSGKDMHSLFEHYQPNTLGEIETDAFVRSFHTPLSTYRKQLIKGLFISLKVLQIPVKTTSVAQKQSRGNNQHEVKKQKATTLVKTKCLQVKILRKKFNVNVHPDVLQGKITVKEAMNEFQLLLDTAKDEEISFKHFVLYYKDISCMVKQDEDFARILQCFTGKNSQLLKAEQPEKDVVKSTHGIRNVRWFSSDSTANLMHMSTEMKELKMKNATEKTPSTETTLTLTSPVIQTMLSQIKMKESSFLRYIENHYPDVSMSIDTVQFKMILSSACRFSEYNVRQLFVLVHASISSTSSKNNSIRNDHAVTIQDLLNIIAQPQRRRCSVELLNEPTEENNKKELLAILPSPSKKIK